MTIPNQITIGRILLIPVFVLMAVYYGQSVHQQAPVAWLYWGAVAAFGVAAASDGIDGYIARRFNQRSRLGVILDPIADKGLLLAALLTLSLSHWPDGLPLWFPILLITRDLILLAGGVVLQVLNGKVVLRATWWGKWATALQMSSIVAVMIRLDAWTQPLRLTPGLVWATALCTVIAGVGYVQDGMAQLHVHGHGDPAKHDQAQTGVETTRAERNV